MTGDDASLCEVETLVSEKRLGRGRWLRKLTRLWCRLVGHRWNPWAFDWPYDVWDLPEDSGMLDGHGNVRDPHPDELLLWARGCDRDCGVAQMTKATLHSAGVLPGDRTALYDNPIRRMVRR